jgi:nucleoside-diphosphate-sugar epimerase
MPSSPLQHALVTGASGFIGRHLVRRLVKGGTRVTCVVRSSSKTQDLCDAGAQITTCELMDRAAMERAVRDSGATVVFHIAGLVRALGLEQYMAVNAGGAEAVAAACAACDQPPALILISSLAAGGPTTRDRPLTEDDPARPVSDYGRSKLAGEQAVRRYSARMPVSIVRPPVVFGPEDIGVLQIIRPIARWGVHLMPGSGEERLSMIHIDDLIDGILRVGECGERVGDDASAGRGAYHMCAEEHWTFAELGREIGQALGRRRTRMLRLPKGVLRAAGHCGDVVARLRRRPLWLSSNKMTEATAGSWLCSAHKASEQLGWKPAAELRARLHDTMQWYRTSGWL